MMTCCNFKKEKAGEDLEDSEEPKSSKSPLKKLKKKLKKNERQLAKNLINIILFTFLGKFV